MKTFGKIIALVFVLCNTACEPDEVSPPLPSPPRNWKTVSISADLAPEIVNNDDKTMFLR